MPRGGRRVALSFLVIVLAVAGGGLAVGFGSSRSSPWRLRMYDKFRHGLSSSRWGTYSGQPGGDPGGWWDASHVVVRHGILDLESYRDNRFGGRWVSGGVSSAPAVRQTYGKYEVRLRMDPGYGIGGTLLLWPSGSHWPPEVDFWENGGSDHKRHVGAATVHYGADNAQVQHDVRADFSKWHTVGVEWTPGLLVFTLDGRRWGRVSGQPVPAEPMEMDIQAQAGSCGEAWAPCPNASTPSHVRLQVAWVRIYGYHSSSHRARRTGS